MDLRGGEGKGGKAKVGKEGGKEGDKVRERKGKGGKRRGRGKGVREERKRKEGGRGEGNGRGDPPTYLAMLATLLPN